MTLLTVRDLVAGYGDMDVLHHIDLQVEEGDFAVVLGANGAGKTTLLRALSGMIRTRGSIRFHGTELTGRRIEQIAALGIAHVPQGRGTFGDLTVEDNLRAGGYLCNPRAAQKAMRKWYEFFPRLAERKSQLAAGLSGGEQQMLAIARALVSEPRLLLLDEPSLGLSPKITSSVFDALSTINTETGTTILVVEQNAQLALDAGNAAFVLAAGHVVSSGSASAMRDDDSIRRAYLGI